MRSYSELPGAIKSLNLPTAFGLAGSLLLAGTLIGKGIETAVDSRTTGAAQIQQPAVVPAAILPAVTHK